MEKPEELLASSRRKLFDAVYERATKLVSWCAEIEESSGEFIRAIVGDSEDCNELIQALDVLVEGTGSKSEYRSQQFSKLCEEIGLRKLLEQLFDEVLLLIRSKLYPSTISSEQSVETPTIDRLVFRSTNRHEELKNRLDSDRVSQMISAIPQPKISFLYNADGSEIEFGKASEGQRTAALLTLLLNQKGSPLIIDQPEGELDNEIISTITEELHTAKSNRQIIIVTHNANLVVNGSAELVFCMGGNDDGKRTVQHFGAIDKTNVRDRITKVMEGGKLAFRARQVKYGF